MNEITLTVVAQILNFFFVWYIFHKLLLEKVFTTIKAQKEELAVLDYSIILARENLKKEEEYKKDEWNRFLLLFSQEIPSLSRKEVQQDITPLCHVAPGLAHKEREVVVRETVAYLVRKIAHGN
jgi:hypothetical protein